MQWILLAGVETQQCRYF